MTKTTWVILAMNTNIRTYSELIALPTFEERYEYARIDGTVGDITFGPHRYLNQQFYQHDPDWKAVRRSVILRDNGCDLAHQDFPIYGRVIVHHLNPITEEDILNRTEFLLNPEYLICLSENTDRAIHFGDISLLPTPFVERKPFDTCPWRH